MHTTDITTRSPEAAITLLCSFNEGVRTKAGTVEPTAGGFVLTIGEKPPRTFPTASGAVEVLLRATKKK